VAVDDATAETPSAKPALNATFFAFGKREKKGVLFGASFAFLLSALILSGALIAFNINRFGAIGAWYADAIAAQLAGELPDYPPPELFALLPSYALVMFVMFILVAAYEAACLRWMTRGEVSGFFGLSLGGDTWLVWFTYWGWLVLLALSYVVTLLLVAALTFGAVFLATLLQVGREATLFAPLIGIPLAYAILVTVAVRFAPAAALSVARRRFSFLSAWRATRNRFWALFGSFLLIWLLGMLAILTLYVLAAVGAVTIAGLNMQSFQGYATPSEAFGALAAQLASPQVYAVFGVCYLLALFVSFALYIALYGINARAALAAIEEGKVLGPLPKG
jgi:hypothetical protein